MTLSPEMCVRGVIDTLQHRIVPALTDSFAGEAARLAGLVLTISANAMDGAVELRLHENAAMRALFRDTASGVADRDLAARLQSAGGSESSDLKISALDQVNAKLRALLVELHASVEDQSGDAARETERRIWRLLQTLEVARAPRR
jgi:hypothetical protein